MEFSDEPIQPPSQEVEDDSSQLDSNNDFEMMKPIQSEEPMPSAMGDNFEEHGVADSTIPDEKIEEPPVADLIGQTEPEPTPCPAPSVQLRTNNPFLCFVVSLYHSKNVNDLLLWKNIPVTAGVLILFLVTAFSMACLSMLSLIGYYGLSIIIIHIAIRLCRKIFNPTNVFPLELMDRMSEASWELPKEALVNAVEKACDSFNSISEDLRDIILVRSYKPTLKAAALLYFLTWIGSMFNLLTLVIIVVVNLFYIPLLFAKFDIMNNKEIHAAVQQVHGHYKHGIEVVVEKVPMLGKLFEGKVKTS